MVLDKEGRTEMRIRVVLLTPLIFLGLATVPDAVSAAGSTTPGTVAVCGPSWSYVAQPTQTADGATLAGASALAVNNVWAVGFAGVTGGPVTEHWNGSSWTLTSAPTSVGSTSIEELNAVSADASDDAWAVGNGYSNSLDREETIAEHWNGTAWKVVLTPSPGVGIYDEFTGVHVFSPKSAWAVGYDSPNSDSTGPIVMRWNGVSWALVTTPAPKGTVLTAVGGTSDHDVWVVGGGLIEHWNGSVWTVSVHTSNKIFFHGVSAFSPTNAFVVGYNDSNPSSFSAVTEQWNGTSWKSVTVPELGVDRGLSAVVAVAQNWYTAVGWETPPHTDAGALPMIDRWTGTAWTVSTVPTTLRSSLNGVTALATGNLWAVGELDVDEGSVIMQRCP
jgi:hypothetical protein